MALLDAAVSRQTRQILAEMTEPVEAECFVEPEDHLGGHLAELLGEVAALQPLLRVTRRDLPGAAPRAAEIGVERSPAVALRRAGDARFPVRFFGLPAGHEFGAFLRILILLSTGRGAPGVDAAAVAPILAPANLKVFVLTA